MTTTAPLSDAVILAMAKMVDDAKSERREPSHSDLDFQINLAQLTLGDPKAQGQTVGKAKRVRGVLSWALENNPQRGQKLVLLLLTLLRSHGGFRNESPKLLR